MSGDTRWWLVLFSFRCLQSVFLIRSLFSPDEFWQSTEVAYNMVYGIDYRTWEWRPGVRIRGYTHPLMFAALFKALQVLGLDTPWAIRHAPALAQAALLAVQDVYTIKTMRAAWKIPKQWALLTVASSWFVSYCGLRTFSNSVEAVVTTAALWHLLVPGDFRRGCMFMGLCFVLRPTSGVLWFFLSLFLLFVGLSSASRRKEFVKHLLQAGAFWLVLSLLVDRFFYGEWTLVPWNFVVFNVARNYSSLYGTHPFHWYVTSGLPVMLGSLLVPVIWMVTLLMADGRNRIVVPQFMRREGLFALLATLLVYSMLAHKEFRFIYPLLPFFVLPLAAMGMSRMSRLLVGLVVAIQIGLLVFFGLGHQTGTLRATEYIASHCAGGEKVALYTLCHHTPFHSYFHGKRSKVRLDFLPCDPSLEPGFVPFDRVFLSTLEARSIDHDWVAVYDTPATEAWLRGQGYQRRQRFRHTLIQPDDEIFESQWVAVYHRGGGRGKSQPT